MYWNKCSKCGKMLHDRIVIDFTKDLENDMLMKAIEIEIKENINKILYKFSNCKANVYIVKAKNMERYKMLQERKNNKKEN
jgi:thermostable 8-oxoguanine DNA glycosylase